MFFLKSNSGAEAKKAYILDQKNLWGFAVSLIINIIHWLYLYRNIKPADQKILLHYNVIYGRDIVGPGRLAYLIPAIALGALLLNAVLAKVLYKKEKLVSYFLSFSTVTVQLIFLIASIVLVRINE